MEGRMNTYDFTPYCEPEKITIPEFNYNGSGSVVPIVPTLYSGGLNDEVDKDLSKLSHQTLDTISSWPSDSSVWSELWSCMSASNRLLFMHDIKKEPLETSPENISPWSSGSVQSLDEIPCLSTLSSVIGCYKDLEPRSKTFVKWPLQAARVRKWLAESNQVYNSEEGEDACNSSRCLSEQPNSLISGTPTHNRTSCELHSASCNSSRLSLDTTSQIADKIRPSASLGSICSTTYSSCTNDSISDVSTISLASSVHVTVTKKEQPTAQGKPKAMCLASGLNNNQSKSSVSAGGSNKPVLEKKNRPLPPPPTGKSQSKKKMALPKIKFTQAIPNRLSLPLLPPIKSSRPLPSIPGSNPSFFLETPPNVPFSNNILQSKLPHLLAVKKSSQSSVPVGKIKKRSVFRAIGKFFSNMKRRLLHCPSCTSYRVEVLSPNFAGD